MQYFEKPEVHVLRGEDAIRVLDEYIGQMRENPPKELTERQAKAMIKLAKGLISVIDEETTAWETAKHSHLMPTIKTAFERCISRILQQSSETHFSEDADPHREFYHYPQPTNLKIV